MYVPFNFINNRLLAFLMQHNQAIPILVYDFNMQFRFHVHLAHRFEILLQISEDIRQPLFVSVSRWYLLVLKLGTISC